MEKYELADKICQRSDQLILELRKQVNSVDRKIRGSNRPIGKMGWQILSKEIFDGIERLKKIIYAGDSIYLDASEIQQEEAQHQLTQQVQQVSSTNFNSETFTSVSDIFKITNSQFETTNHHCLHIIHKITLGLTIMEIQNDKARHCLQD